MVINIGALKDKDYTLVARDIEMVVRAARAGSAITKVIIEAALLADEEKKLACQFACEAGAEFVKTSTGFSIGGATTHDVALMREVWGRVGVKAAGGIRTYADTLTMIAAGANRIGASASVKIMQEADAGRLGLRACHENVSPLSSRQLASTHRQLCQLARRAVCRSAQHASLVVRCLRLCQIDPEALQRLLPLIGPVTRPDLAQPRRTSGRTMSINDLPDDSDPDRDRRSA